jgi:ADP-heptose:LPS heptosyltransferase/glycosyltransferase involved in cell wall biosynthesis
MRAFRSLTYPHTIAVLRALQLGDLLCAVPAFRALRGAFPHATIALISLPWAKAFVERFHHYLDEFIEFPGYPGLPERDPDYFRLAEFLASMRDRQFDWLIQMQGDGSYVNDLIRSCGARQVWGFTPGGGDGAGSSGFLRYPTDCAEIYRHLKLMEFLGAPSQGDHLEFPFTARDQRDFDQLPHADALQPGGFVCIHPGGRGVTRRWSLDGFIQVARGLAERGLRLAITGVAEERSLAEDLAAALPDATMNLAGHTTLGSLGIVLSRSQLLIANDTGVSHVASALRIPSVILSVGSDPSRWNPLDRARHRVLPGSSTGAAEVLAEVDDLLARPIVEASRMSTPPRPLRILTWHIHGNYLYYLTHTPHHWYLPVGPNRPGYSGRAPGFPWPDHVRDIPIDRLRDLTCDAILFQSKSAYVEDQYEFLTSRQRRLPRVYLEHDPPDDPTDSQHIVDDPEVHLIHVTHFNRLMWNNGNTPTSVIEHGVPDAEGVDYSGELPRGLVVINDLSRRGRRVGADLIEHIRRVIPLDVIGMNSEAAGGLGEISHDALPQFMSRYRFFFHPVRYTSFGLAVCEAMMIGLPIVALPVTEMPAVIENGISGYLEGSPDRLMERMAALLADPEHARLIGARGRAMARRRFSLARFTADWNRTLSDCVARTAPPLSPPIGVPCAAKLR